MGAVSSGGVVRRAGCAEEVTEARREGRGLNCEPGHTGPSTELVGESCVNPSYVGGQAMSVWGAQKSSVEAPQKTELPPKAPPEPVKPKPTLSPGGERVAHIGKSITIRGDLYGEEDLLLDGRIEGRVELPNNHLTIGPNSEHIQAELSAKEVTIHGRVVGNVTAKVRVEITESGCVDGNVVAPRFCVREGGQLNGKVTMKAPAKEVAAREAVQATGDSPQQGDLEAR